MPYSQIADLTLTLCGLEERLQDNSPTNQLAVSQLADWSTRRQRIFTNYGITILYLYIKPNPNHNCNPIEYSQRIKRVSVIIRP